MSERKGAAAHSVWPLILTAAAILMITMGARQSLGLFVSPLNTTTGLGIVAISFALAVGQFVWGVSQPIFGAIADKYGPYPRDHCRRDTACGRQRAHSLRLECVDAAPDAWGAGSRRRRSRQLLHPHRRHRRTRARGEARLRGRRHQRGRQLRPVRVRPAQPGADQRLRLGERDDRHGGGGARDHTAGGRAGKAPAGIESARGAHRPRHPSSRCAPSCTARLATRAIGCCTRASSPVASTSLSWSRTCRGKCSCVECLRAWRRRRSRSSGSPTSQAA